MLQMLLKIGEFSPGTFSPCMMSGFPAFFSSATSVKFIDPLRSGHTKVRKIARAMGRCVRGLSIGNAPRLIRLLWGKDRGGKIIFFLQCGLIYLSLDLLLGSLFKIILPTLKGA